MRPSLAGLYAIAAILIAVQSAAAADTAATPARETRANERPAVASVVCLGGVVNNGPAGSYLTVADYPAFAAVAVGLRRFFICGDGIPSFLPSSERARFVSRRLR